MVLILGWHYTKEARTGSQGRSMAIDPTKKGVPWEGTPFFY
jgi:hypothetical protein